MEIINQTANLLNDKVTAYNMTAGANVKKMALAKGQKLEIAAMMIYTDTNSRTGEIMEIVSIKTKEGDTFATNSKTFCRDIDQMVAIFGIDGIPAVNVITGRSNAGREYIRAELVAE